MKELQTTPLLGSHSIVVTPHLIKVRAMKQKDFAQLANLNPGWKEGDGEDSRDGTGQRRRTCQIPETMEILGNTGGFIVVRYGETSGHGPEIDDHFAKISVPDYTWYLWATFMRNRGIGINSHGDLSEKDKVRSDEFWEAAQRTIDKIPQVFVS